MNGLDLWNAVETTDPKYTKEITGKAFRGTTVNNIHVAKKITAKLGPVGMAWGWNVLDERIQEFGSHEDKTYKALHWVRVAMWIKGEDGRKETFENFGTTVMASYTRNGFSLDDEAPKKSMTDALSKLMVYLGGSADVWLNQFDPHNKYAGDEDKPARAVRAAAAAAPADLPPDRDSTPTYLLDATPYRAEEWLDRAGQTAKRLQPSVLVTWWANHKAVRARMYRERPDLKPMMEALKSEIDAKLAPDLTRAG
jgi:hypothetical protein